MAETDKKVSFRQKTSTTCPVCSSEFFREEMFSGGGRLIAGKLTDELRRRYEDNKKYGVVIPLTYVLTVCPSCLYTAFNRDFETLEPSETEKLMELTPSRKAVVAKYFDNCDFSADRNLVSGAASYMLAVDCYGYRNKKVAPTFKIALSSLRAAWLIGDLAKENTTKPYPKISQFFYKKAYQYYTRVLDIMQTGEESPEAMGHMGPDTDKNWGYEGLLYITAILTVKIGIQEPEVEKRIANFDKCKRYLGRLFGAGKSSKSRPGELLDKTRALYDTINQKLDEWTKETKPTEETPEEK